MGASAPKDNNMSFSEIISNRNASIEFKYDEETTRIIDTLNKLKETYLQTFYSEILDDKYVHFNQRHV